MRLNVTELAWRARLAVSRHSRVIAQTAALAVLIFATGGLARLSWLVVEQPVFPSGGLGHHADGGESGIPGTRAPLPALCRILALPGPCRVVLVTAQQPVPGTLRVPDGQDRPGRATWSR
jgi:hypothetical protein